MQAVVMKLCVFLLLAMSALASRRQDRRGENPRLVKINETRYFGDLLELTLKEISQADVIFKYGGAELSANISHGESFITLSNCRVTDMQHIELRSTKHEVYFLYGWHYAYFTGVYSFTSPELSYDYTIKNTSDGSVSTGSATLHLSRGTSEVDLYVDNNSTGQYHILEATGYFGTLGDLVEVKLNGTSDTNVKETVSKIYKKNDLQIQIIPSTALNYYIIKYVHKIDFNDYIIQK